MRSSLNLLLALFALATAGCAVQQRAPGQAFDRIGQDMQGAGSSK